MEVDTPMLVIPQATVGALIEFLDKSAGESALLPDVKLAGTDTPVSVAGLIRLLVK